MLSAWLPGAQHLQNIHPLVVHFPAALLSAAALFYLFAAIARRDSWEWSALWTLVLGSMGAAAAVASGLRGAEGVMLAASVRRHLLIPHRNVMLAVLGLSTLLTAWALLAPPMPVRGRYVFLVLMVLMAVLIAKGADYGGRMVYDYNAGGSACGQPIDFTQ